MVYDARENSATDGSPIEGYKFTGTFRNYLYTSADRDIVINGETYTAISIRRGAIPSGTQDENQLNLELTVPRDIDLVQDYAFSPGPPGLNLEIVRYHDGDDATTQFITAWKGPVTSFSIDGNSASIVVPSIFGVLLNGNVPTTFFQTVCNHVLYDNRCQASRAANSGTSTVASFDGTQITVASSSFTENFLAAGELVNTTKGERRLIISNSGNVINVNLAFSNIEVGDNVEFVAGCDHSFDTCISKFNNSLHFGGHPYIPTINPFEVQEL